MKKGITINLTILKDGEPELILTHEINQLPRQGDRMFVYDVFNREYPLEIKKIGIKRTTPLTVSSVDWIFTDLKYRIDVKLKLSGSNGSDLFKSLFGIDPSFLSEDADQLRQKVIQEHQRQHAVRSSSS